MKKNESEESAPTAPPATPEPTVADRNRENAETRINTLLMAILPGLLIECIIVPFMAARNPKAAKAPKCSVTPLEPKGQGSVRYLLKLQVQRAFDAFDALVIAAATGEQRILTGKKAGQLPEDVISRMAVRLRQLIPSPDGDGNLSPAESQLQKDVAFFITPFKAKKASSMVKAIGTFADGSTFTCRLNVGDSENAAKFVTMAVFVKVEVEDPKSKKLVPFTLETLKPTRKADLQEAA